MFVNKKGYLSLLSIALLLGCSNVTAPKYDESVWSFVVYGDLRQGFGVYQKLALEMGSIKPSPLLAVCLGDVLLRPGVEAEWENFWKYSKPITDRMPLIMVRGNHEGNSPAAEWLLHKETRIPEEKPFYYTRQLKNQKIIVLDTEIVNEENTISNIQLNWLKDELLSAANSNKIDGIFIFMHRPLYRQGIHQDETLTNAAEMHKLFCQNKKIKAVIAGHEHLFNFQNRDDINYIISGGGGAPLRPEYKGAYYHFLKISFSEQTGNINLKAIGFFNEVIENRDL